MGLFGDLGEIAQNTVDLVKAQATGPFQQTSVVRAPGGSMMADPYLWSFAGSQYKEKPSSTSYALLRYLCHRDMLLSTVILTRLRQLSVFTQVRTHDDVSRSIGTGFRVRLKSGAGERTQQTEKYEDTLNRFMINCGREDVQDKVEEGFPSWMWKFARDRLEIDQPCSELQFDRKGELVQFYAVDGATIRLTDPTRNRKDLKDRQYVQLYMSAVVATYSRDEMMFCPENVSTDILSNGYGMAETETAMRQIVTHLGIEETNARVFSPGSMPKGILVLENADISEESLQLLEAKYRSQIATFRGKHKLPLLPLPRGGRLNFVHFPQATDQLGPLSW